MDISIIIIIAVVALLLIYIIAIYNGLITLRNRVENGFAQIDTQLQRRYDLIPNLVETVKGYATHESDVFEKVTAARANMGNAKTVNEKAQADNALTGTLKSLFAVAEAYPALQASANFRELQVELTNTENKISFARQFYNDTVKRFNTGIQKFPRNIIAGMLNFKAFEYYQVESSEARVAPKVSF
ncbi:MAG: LemA family protein [Clostridiales bacterium]|nr:LemA family protein [Clostridiales bacterium]